MNRIQGLCPIDESILCPIKYSQTVPQINQTNISKLNEEKFHVDGNILANMDLKLTKARVGVEK